MRKPQLLPAGKKRGGQPGHRKAHRALVPPQKIHETIHCKPTACRRCGHRLSGEDAEPLIHQVAEPPRIEPIVDEYRLHRLTCPGCFQAMIDRGGNGEKIGRRLLSLSKRLFRRWHKVRDGTLSRNGFQERMRRLEHDPRLLDYTSPTL
jgi:hypothetical protein